MASKLKSVSKSDSTGIEKPEIRVSVEKIENGFIIVKTTEGRDKKGNWQYETKKWYSESDPFEVTDKSLAEIFS